MIRGYRGAEYNVTPNYGRMGNTDREINCTSHRDFHIKVIDAKFSRQGHARSVKDNRGRKQGSYHSDPDRLPFSME